MIFDFWEQKETGRFDLSYWYKNKDRMISNEL